MVLGGMSRNEGMDLTPETAVGSYFAHCDSPAGILAFPGLGRY